VNGEPKQLTPELQRQLALYRLRLARIKAQRAIIVATLAMAEARRKQKEQVTNERLAEMMQQHDRMDA
jgi:hypothetical protein